VYYKYTKEIGFQKENFMEQKLAKHCKNLLDLNAQHYAQPYQSLPVCILDCVFSLRAQYFSTTVPVIDRYAKQYMDGDKYSDKITTAEFLEQIDKIGGCKEFSRSVLQNNQRSGHRLKSEICYELARLFNLLNIQTLADFRNFNEEILQIVVRSVKGIGDAGLQYLFMLAGDQNRCKPDVHIHHCIRDACGVDVSNDECQTLFQKTVALLKAEYPNLTVAKLDGIIWQKYQAKK
jgi:hypothetical protein